MIKIWGLIISSVIFFGVVLPGWALIIEKPTEGQVIVIGEPFQVSVRTEPGEECDSVGPGLVFNERTGRYEGQHEGGTEAFAPDVQRQEREQVRFVILGQGRRCRDAKVNFTRVLPPTTVVQSINAHREGSDRKSVYPRLKLTPQKDPFKKVADEIEVDGIYTDGVKRNITTDPKMTYKSLDEKIATVAVKEKYAVVTPVAPGETEIIISYGQYNDRIKVFVDEVVCVNEGNGYRCPL